jgi:signal recognition particle subunit SRP54
MVLAELGKKLSTVLKSLNNKTTIDEETLKALLKDIGRALFEADVSLPIIKEIRENISRIVSLEELSVGTNKPKIIQDAVFKELVRIINPEREAFRPKRGKINVVMFVGLQGSGKTTSIAKYANYYNRKGWRTCMVCADTFRAGAFDQLKQNATRIRVPFYGSYTESDPVKIAQEGVEQFRKDKYEMIIVDTSGRHKQEADLFTEMEEVNAVVKPDEVIFVMDSSMGKSVYDQAKAFRETVDVGSVIVTKLDGHAKGGGALSAVAATESPITFIGTGEHFDDFETFNAESFVRRMLGMGDIGGLLTKFKESGMLDKQPEMMEKFKKGQFSLRDMYDQFQSVLGMGNIGSIMSMLPGLGNVMPAGMEKDSSKNIERFLTVMDSMTNDELDGNVKIDEVRIKRICRGSGTQPFFVQHLLTQHKQFEKMIGKMGKTGLMKNDAAMAQQMQRNPQQAMQQMARSMDPKMLQKMGGLGNLQDMMKQLGGMDMSQMQKMMGGGGGGPDMGAMMKMMGGGGGGTGGMGGSRRKKGRR